jgi:hypothetical protein
MKTLHTVDISSRQHKAHAARRAVAAAHLHLGLRIPPQSVREAAGLVGVGTRLAKAASDLVASGDEDLLARVLSGQQSLITAAAEIRERAGTYAIATIG